MNMRKKTKSFALTLTTRVRAAMLLIAMLCCATGAWADEVEIGDGTSTNKYVPIGTYYNYSITEQLYTADEIGTAGTITSISFHYTGAAAKDFPIAVYMANVDAEDLESEGISLADAGEVFNGTLSVPAEDGWVTIELDTPFAYDGTSNLLIGINKGWVYYFNGDSWYCTATESKMTRYNHNDGNAYDITATVPGEAINNRPNIKIEITPSGGGVVYNKPTDLIVSDLTSTGATISWTAPEGSPTGYAYQYKKASDADWSAETSVNTTSVALSGLEPAKAYNFRVKAVYGTDGESKFVSIKFTTDCDVITTFPWTENFESYASGNFNAPCWVNEHIDGSGSNIFKISTSSLGGNSTHQLQLPDMNQGTLTKLVLPAMDLNGNYQFVLDVYRSSSTYNDSYASEGIRVFVSADGQIEGATEIGFIPRHYAVSSTIVPAEAASGWYTYEVPIPMTGTCHLILRGESQYCTSTYMDNFVVELVPTCRKPTGVNASDVTNHTATIGWTSEATEWVVAYKTDADEEFTEVAAVTENPYTLTGLAAETIYTVKVRTNCGGGDYSDWTAPVNFTTDIAAPVPTNVAVSNVTNKAATVSWVSDATSFNVQYKATSTEEWQTVTATASPITITGLTPETEYEVQVQGNYGDLDGLSAWSAAVTFTTDIAFPAPTAVAANHVKATKADISWTGEDDATSFNLRYALDLGFYEDFENGLGQWTVVRNGEGDGNTDWHVVNSNTIFSDGAIPAHSGNYVVMSRSYSGSAYNVDNWLISPQVNLGGTMTYWVRDDGKYHEHYDIYVSTTTTDLSAFTKVYEPGNASGEWTEVTVDLSAYAGQQGYVAFRNTDNDQDFLFIDDVTIAAQSSTIDWMTVNNVTSPYTITGLTPETDYVAEVQAVYAGGSSTWAPANFTTLAANAIPFNLQADDITGTTATLSWDGAQDSYNVRYHSVYYFNPFNTDEDRAGWTSSKSIYGTEDTVYNIPEVNNYFLSMGWESTAEDFIYSPELPAYPSGSTLEFYHFYLNEANTFQVGYSTTTNDATAFTWSNPIAATVSYQNGAYTVKYSQTLPDGVKYVAFKATASSQNKCILIDDFKIFKGASNNEWEETVSNVDANTLAITGLTSGTEYEWQVQGNLTNGTTKWISAFFTTTADIELANDATDNSDIIANNADKVANVTLSGRTLYKDGEWNTICLPFDLVLEGSPLEGATAKTLTNAEVTDNGEYTHVELTFGDDVTTLQAGVPYIIKWEASQENIVNPTFTGVLIKDVEEEVRTLSFADYQVQFIGYYDAFNITSEDVDIFYMTAGNELKATGKNRTLKSCRAYFQFSEEAQKARQFVLNFGDGSEATGIVSTKSSPDSTNDGWYTVDGMKLGKQPKRKGVYIQNGRKVVIK